MLCCVNICAAFIEVQRNEKVESGEGETERESLVSWGCAKTSSKDYSTNKQQMCRLEERQYSHQPQNMKAINFCPFSN